MTQKIDCEKLLLKSEKLEDITQGYIKDKKQMSDRIAECMIKSDKLAIQTEEILR